MLRCWWHGYTCVHVACVHVGVAVAVDLPDISCVVCGFACVVALHWREGAVRRRAHLQDIVSRHETHADKARGKDPHEAHCPPSD
jgi:hypothetical protein